MPIINPPIRDLASILTDIRKQLRKLQTARPLEKATISKGGITIQDGGSLRVVDSDGHVVAIIGALPSPTYDRVDGTPQPGVLFNREDGSLAMVLADLNPGSPPFKQSVQILDRNNRVVVADDTNSGTGLAVPHLAASALGNTNTATWPATTNATWTAIANGYHEVQNPKLGWVISLEADANTTGQFRLMIGGVQIGTTQTLAGGASGAFATWAPAAALVTGVSIGTIAFVELDAQRTVGTGTIRAQVQWLSGVQS